MRERFFICRHCGNIVAMIRDSGVEIQCCGEKMHQIIPGATEASEEKHIPIYTTERETVTVSVGAVEHPMTPEHYIEWICMECGDGFQYKRLRPNDLPRTTFSICKGEKVKAVYAFCNQHSLWKA